ncbi:MAG TPA: tRNA pseudouridine(55) synthase TruB [Candidatus Saccharimonadales bacterium]|nr:tRNA pseudouridine(55) synthase TruB [Candidatus Saccharimonadales bacterium]
MQSPNGLLLIDKPAGMTSFGVVARVRRQLSQIAGKKVKVGHTGTLDPFATGLMVIVVGDYCKRAGEFTKLDKSYEATVVLGKTSSTGDPEGEITEVSTTKPSEAQIKDALVPFIGTISQTPPVYSAIKIGGQRAYKLARQGKEVVMPTRQVTIYSLELVSYAYPALKIACAVSSGTYIRTLAEDIGTILRTGAYTSELRRTTVGGWRVDVAISPDRVTYDDLISA